MHSFFDLPYLPQIMLVDTAACPTKCILSSMLSESAWHFARQRNLFISSENCASNINKESCCSPQQST